MWQYLTDSYNWSGNEGIWARIVQHLWYTFAALGLSAVIALPDRKSTRQNSSH